MRRVHQIVNVKPGCIDRYMELHSNVPRGVLAVISDCNITNYSIAYRDGLLFSYFEYTGSDFGADMARMASSPEMQEWWAVCKPLLSRVETETVSDCWGDMAEVFFMP